MPKINVYLPDDLAAAVRDAQVPVSAVCQSALQRAVRDVAALRGHEALSAEPAHGPFTRFTPRARSAIALGQRRAQDHKHDHVGTEHVVLGIIDEGSNLALKVLASLDVEPEDVRDEILASLGPQAKASIEPPPFSPSAKKSLELTAKESQALGHNYIGCEHLLLGVLGTEDGLGGQVLCRMGLELITTRRAVVSALTGAVQVRGPGRAEPTVAAALREITHRLEAIERRLDR